MRCWRLMNNTEVKHALKDRWMVSEMLYKSVVSWTWVSLDSLTHGIIGNRVMITSRSGWTEVWQTQPFWSCSKKQKCGMFRQRNLTTAALCWSAAEIDLEGVGLDDVSGMRTCGAVTPHMSWQLRVLGRIREITLRWGRLRAVLVSSVGPYQTGIIQSLDQSVRT